MEIERKFLVERTPAELEGSGGVHLLQGYLAVDRDSEVRLRRAGDRVTLTVKRGHGESRDEAEVELEPVRFEELWPLTEGRRVEKVRHRIDLETGLVAELDIYSGELEGVSVVEVEFGSTRDSAAFDPPGWFGRELTGDPAWANQGLALNGRPEKALEFRLRPGEPPADGIFRVVAARTAQAAAAVRTAGKAEDPAEHVHEARKSLKKSRSALRLLRGVIDDDQRRDSNQRCQSAARLLSGPRDAEVKLEILARVTGSNPDPAAERWREWLEAEANLHRGDLNPAGLAEAVASIEEVRRRFRSRSAGDALDVVVSNVGRGYRRGRRSMKLARKSGEPEHFHDWRKRAKDLRYQLEILEPRLSGHFTELREMAEELAELLGDLHDLDVLRDDLALRDLDPDDRKRLDDQISEVREQKIGDCLELGKKTYRQKPGRFESLLAAELDP